MINFTKFHIPLFGQMPLSNYVYPCVYLNCVSNHEGGETTVGRYTYTPASINGMIDDFFDSLSGDFWLNVPGMFQRATNFKYGVSPYAGVKPPEVEGVAEFFENHENAMRYDLAACTYSFQPKTNNFMGLMAIWIDFQRMPLDIRGWAVLNTSIVASIYQFYKNATYYNQWRLRKIFDDELSLFSLAAGEAALSGIIDRYYDDDHNIVKCYKSYGSATF